AVAEVVGEWVCSEAEQVAGGGGGPERAVGGAGTEALLVAARDGVGRHGRFDLVAGGDGGDEVAPAVASGLGDGQGGGHDHDTGVAAGVVGVLLEFGVHERAV